MLVMTSKGLYCPTGNFYIDPKSGVDHAVVTHAHSDHARRGARQYYCATPGLSLLKVRLGKNISVSSYNFGETFFLGGVKVSFHSAGHILGSSQVRLESAFGEVWVASGDYKRDADPTCEPFEIVQCDVFVTEATFGTPSFTWRKGADLGREIFAWWSQNAARGVNSVLFAYSLGKAQRVLGVLEPHAARFGKPVYCHPASTPLTDCYRAQGIKLAATVCLSKVANDQKLQGELFLVPQSFLKTIQAQILGDRFETAFASGWMAQGSRGFDRGFLMSDHADWNDLLLTIKETRARRIYVQHRGNGALVRRLRTLGLKAYPDSDLVQENPEQLSLL
jgi:putative mRNA 3-end processing factor